jgi:AcrR family transcriptional regulator
MLDTTSPRGRIIAALLKLAEERPYREIALIDIAREANLRLVELRNEFASKSEILAAFTRAIDDEVARRMEFKLERAASPRDRLFDVIMTRFDALAPYRPALRRILDALRTSPGEVSARAFIASQSWMLAAAGIPTDGARGAARVTGLAALYARVMPIFLADDDPGLARTMAAVDSRLRDGERWLGLVDSLCGGLRRILEPSASPAARKDETPSSSPANGSSPAEPRLF